MILHWRNGQVASSRDYLAHCGVRQRRSLAFFALIRPPDAASRRTREVSNRVWMAIAERGACAEYRVANGLAATY
jgi:hypothetical protein